MKQEIRFCTAADGVRIAYAVSGQGPPLVKAANWLNHLEFDWESPVWRHWFGELSRTHTLLRYDERGNGLSDWQVEDMSFAAWVRDLEAVVEAAGLERFPLLGISQGGPVAIEYALRHPERVTQLILYGAYVRGWAHRPDLPEQREQRRALVKLAELGWGQDNPAFRQVFSSLYIPDGKPEHMEWFNQLARVTTSPANAVRIQTECGRILVPAERLAQVRCPTLVFHCDQDAAVPFEMGREVAAGIPGARLVTLRSRNHLLLAGEPAWPVFLHELREFLGVTAAAAPAPAARSFSGVAPGSLAPGTPFSHYRIETLLGAGGMGVVYRARDEKLDRPVALKVVLPESLADHTARAQLLREARTASALNHPNVCAVHEVGEAAGQLYIAMEYCEGARLADRIPADGLPAETVARYGAQIADALDHAHGRGVVHRDLKAANVILTPEGRAKVLDFGLAVRLDNSISEATRSRTTLTEAGVITGTLPYIAPEVLGGTPAEARSDIWSLGVMLYEMAAGRRPFQGRTGFELTSSILRDAPPPLPAHVSAGLRAVIARCLAKDPVQRYQSAAEVRAALEAQQFGSAVFPAPAAEPASSRQRRARRVRALARARVIRYSLLAVAAALVAGLLLNVAGLRDRLFRPSAGPAVRSLAVLPLENLSADAGQAYFVDGMTEAITTELSRFGGLDVVSLRGPQAEQAGSLVEVGRRWKVDAVLRGSVQRSGENVRVTVLLADAGSGRTLWTQPFDRPLRDVLVTQREVALSVAREIQLALTPQQRRRLDQREQVSPEVYDHYLRGRHHWNRRTGDDLLKAIEHFQQAIALDARHAPAYVGLADSYAVLATYTNVPAGETLPQARAAALRALELDEDLGEAHVPLANVHQQYHEWDQAEEAFRLAIQLKPSHATAHHWYALLLAALGRHREAAERIQQAQKLEPLSLIINANAGWCAYLAGDYDRAIEQALRTLELDSNFAVAHGYLGQAYVEKRMFPEAVAALQRAVALSGRSPGSLAELANAHAAAGNREAAQALLLEMEERRQRQPMSAYPFALIYAGLGDAEQTLAWLEKSYEQRDARLVNVKVHPRFRALRSDPRFRDLLRRMELAR